MTTPFENEPYEDRALTPEQEKAYGNHYLTFWALKRVSGMEYEAVPYINVYPKAGLIEIRSLQK